MTRDWVSVATARSAALVASTFIGVSAAALFLEFGAADGLDSIDMLRSGLILVSTFWLAWGAAHSILGLLSRDGARPVSPPSRLPVGRTAILVPVYNEDPVATFSRVAAMDMSLAALGLTERFDFAILSDTRNDQVAARERLWFERLLRERQGEGRLFYRRRATNSGKKAGNIEDFIQRSGAAYEYAMILDADSLMEGATIAEMVRRMEASPDLGLLQSLPEVIHAQSRFGRAMQFSACFYSPVFARGLAAMQGRTGPFWGHNALVRVRAFASSCGLPPLSGKPPFGGDVLSHDYVEAALLARNGWTVRLDADLAGSYEEGPENILDHAKRDRRWCQGNLQHARLLGAPGLRLWSRFVFLQGILAYVAPMLWGFFIVASIAAFAFPQQPDYFPEPGQMFPAFPVSANAKAIELAIGVFGLLILPKLLIALDAAFTRRAGQFGGTLCALASTLVELAVSSVNAPIMLMYQTRSVLQVIMGIDGGWPSSQRGDGSLTLAEAWAASRWITLVGGVGLLATWYWASSLVLWLLPVGVPMIVAPLIIAYSSRPGHSWLFITPSEVAPTPVVRAFRENLRNWSIAPDAAVKDPAPVAVYA